MKKHKERRLYINGYGKIYMITNKLLDPYEFGALLVKVFFLASCGL